MSAATNTPAEPTATTTLVLSYSGVLYALADKTTTIEALGQALFYMGCLPTAVLDPNTVDHYLGYREELSAEQRRELHTQFVELIERATAEGRVAWRTGSLSTWEELNKLLQQNNLPPIEPTTPHHYSYPGVKEATAAQQLPYAVAHHC